jgi:uncharacterized membrane protein
MIGFTVVLGIMVVIPVPAAFGIITPADVGILSAALLFGPRSGFIVGASSGFLIDLLTGNLQWAPFSLAIHGVEGLVCAVVAGYALRGVIGKSEASESYGSDLYESQQLPGVSKLGASRWALIGVGLLAGLLVMVAGYFAVTWGLYGLGAALVSVPANVVQCALGIVVSVAVLRVATTPAVSKRLQLFR